MLLFLAAISNGVLADERKTHFEGLGGKIVSIVDDMTDEVSGVIFVDFGPIYMGIYGNDNFVIWANSEELLFSHDSTHLIRVGKMNPFTLKSLNKRNGLRPTNKIEAESVIQSLAKGETVKLRFYDWPRYSKMDRNLENTAIGFMYNKAMELFGWRDLGITGGLPDAKVSVHTSQKYQGYARVTVVGNRDISLERIGDEHGGGAHISCLCQ